MHDVFGDFRELLHCIDASIMPNHTKPPRPMHQTGWGVTLPWLSYAEEASDVRDGTDIEMKLTFASEMRIVLAKYSLDGTWLGLEEMSTQVRR